MEQMQLARTEQAVARHRGYMDSASCSGRRCRDIAVTLVTHGRNAAPFSFACC